MSRTCVASLALLCGVLALPGRSTAADAETSTLLFYSYEAGDENLAPRVRDKGGAGNDGTVGNRANIVAAVPANRLPTGGQGSLDTSAADADMANPSGVVTNGLSLLSNSAIAAAGGFTWEIWFYWLGGGGVNTLIDYAGTDHLVIDVRGGGAPMLELRLNGGTTSLPIAAPEVSTWHYAAVVFDTDCEPIEKDGGLTGTVSMFFDCSDPVSVAKSVTKGTLGDDLNRGIGLGQHPLANANAFFKGYLFDSRITLGPLGPLELMLQEKCPLPDLPPAPPSGLTATGQVDAVQLDWDDHPENDVARYRVYRAPVAGGPYTEIGSSPTASEFLDEDVEAGVDYFYVVTAVDEAQQEPGNSDEASAAPAAAGGLQLPGDCNQDARTDLSDLMCITTTLFIDGSIPYACGNGSPLDPANVVLLDWNGDGRVDLSDAIHGAGFQFGSCSSPPCAAHASGTTCQRVVGCDNQCAKP